MGIILAEPDTPADDTRDLTTAICRIGTVCGSADHGLEVPVAYWVHRHGEIVVEGLHVGAVFVAHHCLSDWQRADLARQIRTQMACRTARSRALQQALAEASFSATAEVPA